MPHLLDAAAVRTWCGLALDALGRSRAEIDAINVYPVADGDTGTNLYLTAQAAAWAVDAVWDGRDAADPPGLAEAIRAMAHGALTGARGNSGAILAQMLRGMADTLTGSGADPGNTGDPGDTGDTGKGGGTGGRRGGGADADGLRRALRRAAEAAYEAVAHPADGTILSVADAAADAA
ncbi:DAK2 domain-containing protein, partial [Streptomyces sp. B1866]|uniref:DAK2 domain-containing protein n=1 Tax=Streptomyces sp. B1866 TaxID=3075431 RepID=UPI002890AC20